MNIENIAMWASIISLPISIISFFVSKSAYNSVKVNKNKIEVRGTKNTTVGGSINGK